MGIAVTEEGTVLASSCKEHVLYRLKEEDMLGDTNTLITLTRCCGDDSGHCDGA